MAKQEKASDSQPSKILLDELFVAQDEQFLDCIVQFDSYEFLKHFAIKWIEDARPWARNRLIEYLHGTLNHPGHEVVFKRTLKWALEKDDAELLAHFMVVLDGMVRRKRVTSFTYDYRSRQTHQRQYLFAKSNRTVRNVTGRFEEYTYRKQTFRNLLPDIINRPQNRLFTQKTRAHLRRRVWRHFRFMAYKEPERYVDAMVQVFALYDDSYFSSGEAILDNWALMHAGFYHSPEIAFTPSHTNVVQGKSLSDLVASPYLPEVWKAERVAEKLWTLLGESQSQFVRLWTIGMLQRHHADWLANVSIEALIGLLSSSDATVGEFAVELFRNHSSLAHVEMTTWLRLLDEADFAVLPTICDAMRQHIDPSRLSDDQLIQMTMARPASVASLGLSWIKDRHASRQLDPDKLSGLSACLCLWESEAIADWAIAQLATPASYSTDRIAEFFDSAGDPVRKAACRWLESVSTDIIGDSLFQQDPMLWAKLSETPYDEVRFSLVRLLGGIVDSSHKRTGTSKRFAESLTMDQWMRVYSAVILCVDRGSRSKPRAIRQLAELVEKNPSSADTVIPVLAIAARSIRDPEKYAALSAITALVDRSPDLGRVVSRCMPEWDWSEVGGVQQGGTA